MRLLIIILCVLSDSAKNEGTWRINRGQAVEGSYLRGAVPRNRGYSLPVGGQSMPISAPGRALPIAYVGKVLATVKPQNVPLPYSENVEPISASNSECSELISVRGGTLLIPSHAGVLPIPGSKGVLMIPGCISLANFQSQEKQSEAHGHILTDGTQQGENNSVNIRPGQNKYEIIDLKNS